MRKSLLAFAVLALAACSKPAAEAPAPPATAAASAAPAPVIAPAAAAPAVTTVPESPTERMALVGKGAQSIQCSSKWLTGQKKSPADSGKLFIEAGVAPEIHDVATKIAAPNIAKLEGMRKPANDAERAQMEFAAISMAKDVPVTDPNQLPAIAWMAYFLDKAAQGNCPPPPELLGLIGKQ
jgi:hypothetical protein